MRFLGRSTELLLTACTCAGAMWGCGNASNPVSTEPAFVPAGTAAAPPVDELPWERQIAAVREGAATQIRLRAPVTSEQLQQLAVGCDNLTLLHLDALETRDEDLEAVLPHLLSLRHLVLKSPVGDAGLHAISKCASLEIVNLPQAQCTDAGFSALTNLPLLTLLRIGSPHLTDAGMEPLAAMPNLRFLHLIATPISDDGLEPIKRARMLESFYIDGGKCTDAGLGCLLKASPGLHLHVNQLHLPDHDHGHSHSHGNATAQEQGHRHPHGRDQGSAPPPP